MNYYRRYIGDYMRDTMHLSMMEHGAYGLLLDAQYATEKPLPDSYDALYRLCRAMTKPEQDAVRAVADQFFPLVDDERWNPRAKREVAVAQATIEKQRKSGVKSANKRWSGDGLTDRSTHESTHNLTHNLTHRSTDRLTDESTDRYTGGSAIQPPTTIHQPPTPIPQTPSSGSVAASNTSPTVALAVALRAAGVPDAGAMHPIVVQWAQDGVPVEQALEIVRIAVEDRGKPKPPMRYLQPILADQQNPAQRHVGKTAQAVAALEAMKVVSDG